MSTNCLVTKLKAVVNNDNILKLNELRFKACYYIILLADNPGDATVSILNNNTFSDGSKTVAIPTRGTLEFTNTTIINTLSVSDKRVLSGLLLPTTVLGFEINADDIYSIPFYSLSLGSNDSGNINDAKVHGDISKLFKQSFTILKLVKCTFDKKYLISSLITEKNENLSALQFNLLDSNIIHEYNEFNYFARLTAVKELNIFGSSIQGSIEGFVNMARSLGRTTCDNFKFIVENNSNITFNGTTASGVNSLTETAKSLTWTASTITSDGVTINA